MNEASSQPPEARIRTPSRFSLVWLVPIIAAAIAIYLGWHTLASRGPVVTITFSSGAGLTAGETKVEHKSVAIGTVESVALSNRFSQVTATVRMSKDTEPLLTDHARFWVVRPRFSLTQPSGLQTLVSGSYIAVDPGPPGGNPQRHFQGLDQPPAVRSDEAGRTFTLQSPRLGWLETGAPVFYRNIEVGQLLDYQDEGMDKPIQMHVFIRAPYDDYVRDGTRFWNTSGLSVNLGPGGVHVAVESMQALFAGGIQFANFQNAASTPPAAPGKMFELYQNETDAENASFPDNIHFVAYFNQSAAGLQPGSAVQLYGIRVGTVSGTQLQLDPTTSQPSVRVTFDIQPARVYAAGTVPSTPPLKVTQDLVHLGMRARLDTANLITGQEVIGLDMVPNAPAAQATTEGDLIVWPSSNGGFQDLTDSVNQMLNKLNNVPLEQLGNNAQALLTSLRQLAETANSGAQPLASKLPELMRDLQSTLQQANQTLASIKAAYGVDSATHRDLQQLTTEASRALNSLRQLTDYLDRHPSSVLWGR
jgi:paraquat-inducible protein B